MNMQRWFDKDGALTVGLILLGVLAVNAMLPVRVTPVFTLEISKNGSAITGLHQQRRITASKRVAVDVLDLANKHRLRHPTLGNIGYDEHFFIDLDTTFTVKVAGDYRFAVASDDGFAIEIDGAELCSFTGGRALTTQSCGVALDAGEHTFRLTYYQGGGPAGLSLKYARQDERSTYWFGEESKYFGFDR